MAKSISGVLVLNTQYMNGSMKLCPKLAASCIVLHSNLMIKIHISQAAVSTAV